MEYTHNGTSNRHLWEFPYSAKQLVEAAKKKKAYRESRVTWWENEKEKIMEEVRAGGIEISESVAAGYSNSVGSGPQVMVRTDLQKKLTECHNKIIKHMEAVREYDGWIQVFSDRPAKEILELRHQDWLFFFGQD